MSEPNGQQAQPQVPQLQITPLLAWELGFQPGPTGQPVIVVNAHTVVGAIRFYLDVPSTESIIDSLQQALAKCQEPQLLLPARVLMGPNGQPIAFPASMPAPGPGEPVGPAQEQIRETPDEPEWEGR